MNLDDASRLCLFRHVYLQKKTPGKRHVCQEFDCLVYFLVTDPKYTDIFFGGEVVLKASL